jgi:hypothetical protein
MLGLYIDKFPFTIHKKIDGDRHLGRKTGKRVLRISKVITIRMGEFEMRGER